MVSTRSIKYKFCENEKVLCYEPDPTKAKVLYDSKVLEIIESKDKKCKRLIEYLIHFQGWNSSWDRRVCEDFVLKDTEENRQLQRDLAKKSQLQIGAYLYRKDRKKRSRNYGSQNSDSKNRNRCSSEDGNSSRDESESYSSSVESSNDDERIVFRLGQRLKEYLENDFNMINGQNKLIILPAKISVVTILENFVKQYSVRVICNPNDDNKLDNACSKRKRKSNQFLTNKKNNSTDNNNLENTTISIDLCKEVADGLRIYFDFTLKDYLLYKNEKVQSENLLSETYLKNFTYTPSDRLSIDLLQNIKQSTSSPQTPHGSSETTETISNNADQENPERSTKTTRRRLRSYNNKMDETDNFDINSITVKQENCKSSIASTSSDSSTLQINSVSLNMIKSTLPLNIGIPIEGRELLQKTLQWTILPVDAPAEPSMIYGGIHLARLLVKLPDFLNATSMSDEKLKFLLKYLDSFIEFLEQHSEWFGESNYCENQLFTIKEEPDLNIDEENEKMKNLLEIKKEKVDEQFNEN